MLNMARVTRFFQVMPLAFTGDYNVARPVTKEEQTAQRKIVRRVRRLAKRNSSHSGLSRLSDGRNVSWLYLPAKVKFRHDDGRRGLNIRYSGAMIAVSGRYFTLKPWQIGCEHRSYLVSAGKANAYVTVHMVIHVYDYHLNAWAPMPERRLDPTTEFIEQDDLFRPDADELRELYDALVAIH